MERDVEVGPQRWVIHVDMDAFFAAVEQRDRPELRGQPVVVGAMPGSRGVVSTCSYEARVFGIRSAMPIAEAHRRCPGAIFIPPDMRRYKEASQGVMRVLNQISPLVEQISVDEAYLDITGLERLYGDPDSIGARVKQLIRSQVGLSCSVGIGPNRLIAKLASDHDKPDGLVWVAPQEVEGFLDPMPLANLRGVGPKTLRIVQRLGIRNVAELRTFSLPLLCEYFGEKMGGSLYRQARGIASAQVGNREDRRSLSKETTFNQDVADRGQIRQTLHTLAADVGHGLRREGLRGRVVSIKIRLGDFSTHTRQCRLHHPEQNDQALFKAAWELFQASPFIDQPLRLIGLSVSHWEESELGLDLFDDPGRREREEQLYRTMDRVNERFGRGKLARGVRRDKKR